jgi:hypothetical protein
MCQIEFDSPVNRQTLSFAQTITPTLFVHREHTQDGIVLYKNQPSPTKTLVDLRIGTLLCTTSRSITYI